MKKILAICLLLLVNNLVEAQNQTETVEWINAKKVDIMNQHPPTDQAQNFDTEEISSHLFPSKDDNVKYQRLVKWSDITDISFNSKVGEIVIKGKVVSASGENYIILSCKDSAEKQLIEKFLKALRHMATLNGAKLVKDDLF